MSIESQKTLMPPSGARMAWDEAKAKANEPSEAARAALVRPLHQKLKGLVRSHWHKLPEMWAQELEFRSELEGCLNGQNALMKGAESTSQCH